MITVEAEAHAPEELPLPTTAVRWWVAGDYSGIPLLHIQGERDAVVGFLADHWGPFYDWAILDREAPETDEEINQAVDNWLSDHAVQQSHACDTPSGQRNKQRR